MSERNRTALSFHTPAGLDHLRPGRVPGNHAIGGAWIVLPPASAQRHPGMGRPGPRVRPGWLRRSLALGQSIRYSWVTIGVSAGTIAGVLIARGVIG